MSKEIEIEKTYLAKFLPSGFKKFKSKKIIDIYLPQNSKHAKLRIRKSGDSYTVTKKNVLDKKTASIQLEESILITVEEFKELARLKSNIIKKTRYYYPYKSKIAEIDVFEGRLKGLVLIDFEFKNKKESNNFKIPNFCLADVTEEENIAGGVLCRHSLTSLKKVLNSFSYRKIIL